MGPKKVQNLVRKIPLDLEVFESTGLAQCSVQVL